MAAPGQFQPGSAAVPSSQVEISVSCRNLRDRDTFSKSDPICVLFIKDIRTNSYYEYGRTEMIKDTLNPDFVKKLVMNYFFEECQRLKFEVYDVDSPSQRLDVQDFLGRIECTLGEIVGGAGSKIQKNLQGLPGRNTGIITVRAEEVSSCKEVATFQFRATGLDKKDFFGKSDPFLIFYRSNEDGSFTAVHKTEVVKNTLNPTWQPFTIPVRTFCNGDYDRSLKVECFDWDSDGGHDLIGEFRTTLRELSKGAAQSGKQYEVIHPKKKEKKRSYKNSGEVQLLKCLIEVQPSFLDYVKGGTQLNFTVAIDFTASNGNPSQPTSLHYMNPYTPNQYASAIQAVGEIIQDYDSDKLFPVLGFGARLPDGSVSHEFAVNFNPSNPYVAGIPGILQAYHAAIQRVALYGPTNFSPVINHVAKFGASSQDGSNYFVLLILTDGVITDMDKTIAAIVNASHLPMSIIIVGVGNDPFEAMNILDADNNRLSHQGRYAERDIVQFVPFREFLGSQHGGNLQISQAALAKEVLAEVPGQFLLFMKKHGIKPKPPREDIKVPSDPGTASVAPPPVPQGGMAPPPAWAMGGQQQQQAQGSAPYPQGAPPSVPQRGSAPPPPQGGYGGQAPYPQGGQAPPHGGGSAPPYPQGAPPSVPQRGSAPPPPQGGYGGQAPYPQSGHAPPPGGAPTPFAQNAANPQQSRGSYGGAQPPYPQTGGAPPYPQQGGTAPPYPQGGTAPPYPQTQGSVRGQQAPYPQGQGGGTQPPYPQR